MKGTVKWFNNQKGFGFIQDKAGNDAFIKLYRLMLRFGCEVKSIKLPSGVKDFCDYYLKITKD